MTDDYRYIDKGVSLECCLTERGLVKSLTVAKDNDIAGRFEQGPLCHQSSDVKLREIATYSIHRDESG